MNPLAEAFGFLHWIGISHYLRLFGGRQPARSIHFLSLLAIVGFTIVHVLLVAIEDFPRNMAWIIHGHYSSERLAVWIGLAGLIVVRPLDGARRRISAPRRRAGGFREDTQFYGTQAGI